MKKTLTALFALSLLLQGQVQLVAFADTAVPVSACMLLLSAPEKGPLAPQTPLSITVQVDAGKPDPSHNGMVKLFVDGQETPWDPTKSISVKTGAQLRLLAVPNAGFVFSHWNRLPKSVAMEKTPDRLGDRAENVRLESEVTFAAGEQSISPTACFLYRPEAAEVDLVADYRLFLAEMKLANTPEEINAFDRGDTNFSSGDLEAYMGDGVPDIVQFALANAVFKIGSFDLAREGGLCDFFVMKDYRHNVALAASALPMASPAVQRVVAVYMMTGNLDSDRWLAKEIKKNYSISIADVPFKNSARRWLGMHDNENVDNDHKFNHEEWKDAVEKAGPGASMEKKLEIFTDRALDPDKE